MNYFYRIIVFFFIFPFYNLNAQDNSTSTLLKDLINTAIKNYPLLKSKGYEVQATEKGVTIGKRSLVPTLDASYQANYATYIKLSAKTTIK